MNMTFSNGKADWTECFWTSLPHNFAVLLHCIDSIDPEVLFPGTMFEQCLVVDETFETRRWLRVAISTSHLFVESIY